MWQGIRRACVVAVIGTFLLQILCLPSMAANESMAQQIRKSKPDRGQVEVWWLGQTGFILKGAGVTYAINPYLTDDRSRLEPAPITPEELDQLDYVLLTSLSQAHYDRLGLLALFEANPTVHLIAPKAILRRLEKDYLPADRCSGIVPGERLQLEQGLAVVAVAANHPAATRRDKPGDLDKEDETETTSIGYFINQGGFRIYHTGSAACTSAFLKQRTGKIDLLMVPIDGANSGFGIKEAVQLTHSLHPTAVVPMQFGTFVEDDVDPSALIEELQVREEGVQTWVPEVGADHSFGGKLAKDSSNKASNK